MSKRTSLRHILAWAWIVPGMVAAALSVGAFLVLGWYDYQNALKREVSDLDSKSVMIARRLSAEVLLGNRGAVDVTSNLLERELGIDSITVSKAIPDCSKADLTRDGYCFNRQGDGLLLSRPLPLVQDPTYVQVHARMPSFLHSLQPTLLLWSFVPVLLIVGFGMLAFQRVLRRYVIEPVETLAASANQGSEPPQFWPTELANLAKDLHEAFVKRDQALVSQLAGGVIHDLRTLLHSAWSAAQLAEEQPAGSEKRAQRLEVFLRAAQTNFPKMEGIIQTTLDGVREIRVTPRLYDLSALVTESAASVQDLAARSQVELTVDAGEMVASFCDPIQLERAVSNILKNAVEAAAGRSDRPAKVLVRIPLETREGIPAIVVEDSGPGLGDDPNRVLHSIHSTKVHGAGLGLTVSRKIVEAHGGTIAAGHSSTLGGARFEIVLEGGGVL